MQPYRQRQTPGTHRTGIFYRVAILASLPFLTAGCSLGFQNLHPGQMGTVYEPLFADIISPYDQPRWLWVRGVIGGDFDANGKVEEEAVIATIQTGSRSTPEGIESAYLAICRVEKDGTRTAIARTLLFDSHPVPTCPRLPDGAAVGSLLEPLRHARAQIVQDKVKDGDTVVVYFWGSAMPTSVWYAGYVLRSGDLTRVLETVEWQSNLGFIPISLEKRVGMAELGYQLVFPVEALPTEVSGMLGARSEVPLWGNIFAKERDGRYRQADEQYGQHYYRRLENSWHTAYLKALFLGLDKSHLAWFEYYLGLLNQYQGQVELAGELLAKSAANAKSPVLRDAVAKALDGLADKKSEAGEMAK